MGRLDGKVAVITGTGDGMGRTAAVEFAAQGAKVVGCDINPETAQETLRLVRDAGGEMALSVADLTVEENAHELFELAHHTYGGVDLLYNNAMSQTLGTPEHMPLEAFEDTLRGVVTLPWLVTKHAIPHLRRRGGGAILFIGSATAGPTPGFVANLAWGHAYGMGKAAIVRLTEQLAVELAHLGIRVNAISPGPIGTPIGMTLYGEERSRLRWTQERHMPMGRIGQPSEVVRAALFLLSDDASYVTGQNLAVDGGWAASGGFGAPDPEAAGLAYGVVGEWLAVDDRWTGSGSPAAASEFPASGVKPPAGG